MPPWSSGWNGPGRGPWTIFGAPCTGAPREEEAGSAQVEPASDQPAGAGGPHPLHRLYRLRQQLPQRRHHHGAGPGGLCLPGGGPGAVCPLRPLHRCVPCCCTPGSRRLFRRCSQPGTRMTPSARTPPPAACSQRWRTIFWKAAAWYSAPRLTASSTCATSPASARRTCGTCGEPSTSRAIWAETFRTVKKALETRQVLFSGTPCQVDGLYRYLGGRPENLTTCDLVCHGVPSPGVWEAYGPLH